MSPAADASIVSLPWPARLFGDLQEPFGLPAVEAAVELRTVIRAVPRADGRFSIAAQGLDEPITLEPGSDTDYAALIPSLVKALEVVRARKLALPSGYDFQVASQVKGLRDLLRSPILTTAWVVALTALAGAGEQYTGNELADLAAEAFTGDWSEAWGRPELDAAILGGLLCVEPEAGEGPRPLNRDLPSLIVGGLKESDVASQPASIEETAAAIKQLEALTGQTLRDVPFDDAVGKLQDLPDDRARIAYAHLMIRDRCRVACELLDGELGFDDDRFGELMDGTHEVMRDMLDRNHEPLEKLLDAAAEAGAVGCKQSAAAGRFVAFAPGKEEDAVEAVRKAGGHAQSAGIADGVRIEGSHPA